MQIHLSVFRLLS